MILPQFKKGHNKSFNRNCLFNDLTFDKYRTFHDIKSGFMLIEKEK